MNKLIKKNSSIVSSESKKTTTYVLSLVFKTGATLFVFMFLANVEVLLAQNTQTTENKADQNLKSSARVNPSTLAMEFSLPLGGYPGRNGNSLPIIFNYSSKVWNMKMVNSRFESSQVNQQYYDYLVYQSTDVGAFFAEKTAAGWTSTLGAVSFVPEQQIFDEFGQIPSIFLSADLLDPDPVIDEEFCFWTEPELVFDSGCLGLAWYSVQTCCSPDAFCVIASTNYECVFGNPGGGGGGSPQPPQLPQPVPPPPYQTTPHQVYRVRIRMPDGTSHDLRRDDHIYNCVATPACYQSSTGATYLSTDGTGLRLKVGEQQSNQEIRDVLYLPDGGKYIFPAQGTQRPPLTGAAEMHIDRNGNISTYSATGRKWTDNTGRVVQDMLPTENAGTISVGTQAFNLAGVNESNRNHTITWKRLENAFENPQSTSTKILGEDGCNNVLPNPVTGAFLFANQPVNPLDDQIENRTRFIRKHRACSAPSGWGGITIFNPVVLSDITLPNGQKYEFKYNEYGEITKIIYPTGGYERFEYGHVDAIGVSALEIYTQSNRGVRKRFISFDGITETQEWIHSETATIAPDGSRTERVLHESSGSAWGFEDPRNGMVMEERSKDSAGEIRSRTLNDWEVLGPQGTGAYADAKRDPRVKRSVSIMFEPGSNSALATLTETEYDDAGSTDPEHFSHLNPKRKKSYHYAVLNAADVDNEPLLWTTIESWFPQSKLASITETDYVYNADYKARGIPSLPIRTKVLDPSNPDPNNPLAMSETIYDNALPASSSNYPYSMQNYGTGNSMDCSSDPQNPKICWQNPNGPGGNINMSYRGLPTTSRTWVKETDTWIETHTQYDQFGNTVKAKDPIGNEATTEFSASYKYAYPTKVIVPEPDPTNTHGTNQTSTAETTYDFTTGLPLTVKDDFGQITRTEYDAVLRPFRVFAENFTAPESQTVYGVPDANGQLPADQRFVKVRKQIDAVNWDEAITWFDGLGRTIKTHARDSQGDVFVETHYDAFGRVDRVTNPYRIGDTVYWSKTRYDEAGRAVETYAPAELANLGSAHSLGVTSFDISTVANFVGTVVISTDASGRKGRSITNALGQLLRVDEPTAIGGTADADLGALATPNQPTFYKYDLYGKMVEVTQGVQKRWFKYDSLGRLIRVRQPEQEVNTALNLSDGYNTSGQWSAGFTYDILGNVLTATDANGTTITNTYDRANRVKTRTYSGEPAGVTTPPVSFFYDGKGLAVPQSPNFAKGKLTKVTSSVSETQYTQFDNLGRLLSSEQRTPLDGQTVAQATPYVSSYVYNLSGALVEETYPSGRKVKNEFESDGDLARIYGKATPTAAERTYANTFSYTPDGRIERLRLGNGLWEAAKFNTRLQVTELALGHGVASGDVWKLGYEYGELNADGTVNTAKNTGNIAKQMLSFNGLTQPFVTGYRYDSLYRLTEAKETQNSVQTWKQNLTYDRYGNRLTHDKFIGTNQVTQTNITHPTIDANTNRFNANQGYLFDKNGNLTTDAQNRSFVFNGDNKQKEVRDESNNLVGEYFYDGEGKRVKKVTNLETTVFVYSSGKLIAEYSTATPPQSPTTSWTVTDQLGSPRVLVNSLGEVVSRRDFMPFGEELSPDGNHRTANQKYGSNNSVRQKFTGYQKDDETGLDFAEARMYQNLHGRFTAVDPLLASGKSGVPQTFNRYVYVINNPLAYRDPSGLQIGDYIGRIYYNPENGSFGNQAFAKANPELELRRYNGAPMIVVGSNNYRYRLEPFGVTQLGLSEGISNSASLGGSRTFMLLQNPLQNLPPEIINRMEKEVEAMGQSLLDLPGKILYRVIPDSVDASISLPFYSGGLELSKNGNLFGGGSFTLGSNITDWLKDIKTENKALRPKFSLGVSARYFDRNLREEQRDNAISGADLELQIAYVTLATPATGDGPRSIKIGRPGFGFGGSYTSEKLVDFQDDIVQPVNNLWDQYRPRFFTQSNQ